MQMMSLKWRISSFPHLLSKTCGLISGHVGALQEIPLILWACGAIEKTQGPGSLNTMWRMEEVNRSTNGWMTCANVSIKNISE